MKPVRLTVEERLRALRRDDLEAAAFPLPDVAALLQSLTLVRVTRLSRFWVQGSTDHPAPLHQAMVDWLAGLHGLQRPWAFVMRSEGVRLECWYGASLSREALQHSLRGVFTDVRFNRPKIEAEFDWTAVARLQNAVRVTGSPAARPELPQVEKICRAFTATGKAWCYALRGDSISDQEIGRLVTDTEDALLDVRLNYLGRGEAVHRPHAERIAQLLDARLKRLEAGRRCGLWRCQAFLLAENAPMADLATGVIRSAFAGDSPLLEPLRVHRCMTDAPASSASSASPPPPELPEPLSSVEVAGLARPPIESYAGYELVMPARFGVETISAKGPAVSLGAVTDRGRRTRSRLRVPLVDLTRHALVSGVTGSGKTNTCFRLLNQLWHTHRVPFLVIEPAKSEYRRLLASRRWKDDLLVFTAGHETVSPLHLNPFEVPAGVLVQSHIDYLKALFQAAFVLWEPMPQVLETSLHDIYRLRGWDLAANANARGESHARSFPLLDDLIERVKTVVPRLGYSDKVRDDIQAALVTRLESLRAGGGKGPLFGGRTSDAARLIFERPCILELKQIMSEDEKAFVMGLLLIRLYEHHEANSRGGLGEPALRHVTIIEEAHRLLRDVPMGASSETANPRGQSLEVFANMLAEIRAYGEGIVIAEQIPSKLTRDVIKNTNLKIAHRLTAREDRELLGGAMTLDDAAASALTRLECGSAAVFAEGLQQPVLVSVPRSAVKDAKVDEAVVADAMSRVHGTRALRPLFEIDAQLARAFGRAFHACTREEVDSVMVAAAFAELRQIAVRSAPPPTPDLPALWRHLADKEITRRADRRAWSHQQVEECVERCADIGDHAERAYAASAALARLEAGESKPDRKSRTELRKHQAAATSALYDAIERFTTTWDRLHGIGIEGPFAACRHCARPCLYRDVSVVATEPETDVFDPDSAEVVDALAKDAIDWSFATFHRDDMESIFGASVCRVVQQISVDAVRPTIQRELAELVRGRIVARLTGEE